MNKVDKSILLKNKFDIMNNSVSLISILFAILIILFHSYPLFYGMNVIGPVSKVLRPYNIGKIVVCAFFFISGFMISKSIKKSKTINDYMKKRIKKIFPGLIAVLLITVFVIAPIVSSLQKGVFLRNPELYLKYLFDNILLYKNTVYSIDTVFIDNAYPNAINGSLWSIKHTFFSYIVFIPVYVYILKNKKSNRSFMFFYLIFFVMYSLSNFGLLNDYHDFIGKYFGDIGVFNENKLFIENLFFFFTGVLYDLFSDKIYIKSSYFLISIITYIILLKTPLSIFAFQIAFPYIIMYLMCLKTRFKAKDISYYIYLFGFMIQQTIYHYLKEYNLFIFMILSIVITIIFAILLNIFINKTNKLIKNVKLKEVKKV